jgi:carbamoylphosphate synthase small subunit
MFLVFMVNHLFFIVYNSMIVIILILGIDTRMLTKKLREHGTMLGKVKSSYFFVLFFY